MGFVEFIEDTIWVPIVVGVVVLAVGIIVICVIIKMCRKSRDYEQVPLLSATNNDIGLGHRIQRENEKQYFIHRDTAWLNSQFYLRSNPQYNNVQQMEDLGRRTDKHWFRVYDSRSRSNMFMTMAPKSEKLTYLFTKENRKLVKDMVLLLQHPFILPVADIDFMVDQGIIVVLYPVCSRGSLKDYIYQSRCTDPWKLKYKTRNRGLNVTQIKCFGKQILMALLYLEEKGFPTHGHVHSANIVIENNKCSHSGKIETTARLMACESCLLCEEPKLYPVLRKKLKNNKSALDVLCFGHLIFEMCAGYELTKAHPDPGDLYNCINPGIVEVLNFIFPEDKTAGYPTLKEISELKFFSEVPLPELAAYNFSPISLSKDMKSLLKSVTRGQPMTRKATMKRSKSSVVTTQSERDQDTTLGRRSSAAQLNTNSVPPTPPPEAPPTPSFVPPPLALAPPPPPPVALSAPVAPPPSTGGRSALLGSIRKGAKLKKTVTNDRSAPKV